MVSQHTSGGLSDEAIKRKLWCDVYVASVRVGEGSSTCAILAEKAIDAFSKQFPITQNTVVDADIRTVPNR